MTSQLPFTNFPDYIWYLIKLFEFPIFSNFIFFYIFVKTSPEDSSSTLVFPL